VDFARGSYDIYIFDMMTPYLIGPGRLLRGDCPEKLRLESLTFKNSIDNIRLSGY
jgi:hypothetical protein